MFLQPDHARFAPLARSQVLKAQLMQLGYQCLGPAVENDAIVMRELDTPDGLPAGQAAGRCRQWLSHKLAAWRDPFGRSGCVGCGRCIAWCPAGINLTEEVATFTAGGQP